VIGGAASARFHRPDSGLGLTKPAIASLKAGRKLETLVKLWDVAPADDLLSKREANEAYATARLGKSCVIYFTDGGSVGVNLAGFPAECERRWISIESGEWGDTSRVPGGGNVMIDAPAAGGWLAVITADAADNR
jgi:hypothetical protein